MRIALMLSIPYWLLLSLETKLSKSSQRISLLDLLDLADIQLIISLLVFTYHIPSQPIIIKSMFSFFVLVTSGHGLIICSYGLNLVSLYSWSPSARERLRPPFTRPQLTEPPAFLILQNYIGSSGLWSLLNYLVQPFMEATDLESPALAQQMQSGVIRTTLAVHPAWDSYSYLGPLSLSLIYFCMATIYFFPASDKSNQSILTNVYFRASQQFLF